MTESFRHVNQSLFKGQDPYAGFVPARYRPDLQGWNSQHVFLSQTIKEVRPSVVIEVGVWKGGSTIHMAQALRDNGIDGVVVSVDTFLGSWEHYEQEEYFPSLMHQNGYPTLFYTFMTNVVEAGVQEYVHPLPLDSSNAFFVLNRKGIQADVVHIDAGHDYEAVQNDLRMWWQVLKPGGILIADDYDSEGVVWPPVRDAVDDFLRTTPHEAFEPVPYKARFRKPRV